MSINYLIHLGTLVSIYSLLGVSLNLSLGFTGLINLGHVAIYGLGAYCSVILSFLGVPIYLSIFIGGLFAAFMGFFLIYFTRKLKGDYFAMATLSFSFVIHNTLLNWDDLTLGSLGITNIARPLGMDENMIYLVFVSLITILSILFIKRMISSPFGHLLQGVRDDEVLLRTMGKNTFKIKIKAICISSFFAGLAGGLFAHYIGYLHPDNFNLNEIIILLTIVIVGGLASIKGSVVATLIIVLLPEVIRLLNIPLSILGPLRQIIYGVILIAILMFHSRGIFGKVDLE